MTPSWRDDPETAKIIAQSKRAIAELTATAAELDKFVAALMRETEDIEHRGGGTNPK
jgi:hypothetical protein